MLEQTKYSPQQAKVNPETFTTKLVETVRCEIRHDGKTLLLLKSRDS